MNLWIVFIFNIISMQNFSCNQVTERQKWRLLKKELDALKHASKVSNWGCVFVVKEGFEESKYSKSEYLRDLRLYTARIDDYTGTCIQPVFYCYCEEIKVVLEEICMSGEENVAKILGNTLDNMRTYLSSKSELPDGCKKCEEYEEKSFQEFMNSFETLAQRMNAQ